MEGVGARRNGPWQNILIVGETGAGKSSTFNLLLDTEVAQVHDTVAGVTQEVQWFQLQDVDRPGKFYKVYDSPGLSEGVYGTVPGCMPKDLLETLLRQRVGAAAEGISAFLMVIQKGRILNSTSKCYEYLHALRGKDARNVPIIAVITHFDREYNNEQVEKLETFFQGHKMEFAAILPACALPLADAGVGQEDTIRKRRDETRKLIFDTLADYSLHPGWKPKRWIQMVKDSLPVIIVPLAFFFAGVVFKTIVH